MSTHWDLAQLATFVSIAETGSITETARQLHLTQPAASKRLQQLEQHLSIALFDRINKQLLLTQAGHSLLPRARELLFNAQDIQHFASSLQKDVAGDLKIATSHHIGLRRLPPYLCEFRKNYRDVNLQIDFLDSEAAIADVLRGKYEIAIVTLPEQSEKHNSGLLKRTLWHDPLHLVASADHPLATLATGKMVDLEEIAKYPSILPEKDTHTYQIVANQFAHQGLTLNINMHNNYMETILMLVSCGFGWSVLPETLIANNTQPQIVIIPTLLELSRDLGLITHTNRTLSRAASALIETLNKKPLTEKMLYQS